MSKQPNDLTAPMRVSVIHRYRGRMLSICYEINKFSGGSLEGAVAPPAPLWLRHCSLRSLRACMFANVVLDTNDSCDSLRFSLSVSTGGKLDV